MSAAVLEKNVVTWTDAANEVDLTLMQQGEYISLDIWDRSEGEEKHMRVSFGRNKANEIRNLFDAFLAK